MQNVQRDTEATSSFLNRLFGRLLLAVIAAVILIAILFASGAEAALSSQQKLRKSETVVAWYEGKGSWHLRPGFVTCSQIRFDRPAARCWKHRLGYSFHKRRVERLRPRQPTLSHLAGWLCIHSREGAWTDTGDPYWGGLQMGWWFMRTYGGKLLAKGPASNWTPAEQMAVAEGAYLMSGYSDAFMRGQWPNTYPPCAHLF